MVKRTFYCTTQLAMGSFATLPLRRHFKSRTPQLNIPRIAETFATDMLFESVEGIGGSLVPRFSRERNQSLLKFLDFKKKVMDRML